MFGVSEYLGFLGYFLIFQTIILSQCCNDPLNGVTYDTELKTGTSITTWHFTDLWYVIKSQQMTKMWFRH